MRERYRCTDCRAEFAPRRKRCLVCGTVGAETDHEYCWDCGARLDASSHQQCPACGSSAVERVAATVPDDWSRSDQ